VWVPMGLVKDLGWGSPAARRPGGVSTLRVMMAGVNIVAMEHVIPAGALGPAPVTLDVRAYVVPHGAGVMLVDTGMDAGGRALDEALRAMGADWSDVSHIMITHGHPDHIGGLDHARSDAPRAAIMASPYDRVADTHALADASVVGPLRVVATPGHTAGHLSFVDESQGILFVGDCVGTVAGELTRAPQQFTADQGTAEHSLRGLRTFRGMRMLFSHGEEIEDPWDALEAML